MGFAGGLSVNAHSRVWNTQTRWIIQNNENHTTNVLSDGLKDAPSLRFVFDSEFPGGLRAVLMERDDYMSPGEILTLHGHWGQIVQLYTQRDLTVPTDRPPEISGIATRYAKVLRYEYWAGLWKFRMPSRS